MRPFIVKASPLIGTIALVGFLATPISAQNTPPAAATLLTAPKGAMIGTMQELMRGIFFPNANMIFNAQSHDPAEKKPLTGPAPGGPNFDWVRWGQGLYTGWDDIDYAAIALAEASPMMLTPGRTCENGRPVPVERADWIKFTDGMVESAKKVLVASKTKNQENVSDSTNDLNDACQNCHRVYRGPTRCVAPMP